MGLAAVANQTRPILRTIEAHTSTGNLNLLDDAELRSKMSGYLEKAEVNLDIQRSVSGYALQLLGPALEQANFRMGIAHTSSLQSLISDSPGQEIASAIYPGYRGGLDLRVPKNISAVFSDRRFSLIGGPTIFLQNWLYGMQILRLLDKTC